MNNAIPLVNLQRQHAALKEELLSVTADVIDRNAFVQSEDVRKFEQSFGDLLGVRHVIGCSNGTSALALALEAVDVGPGDEVITASHTFFATGEAIAKRGAVPVFVDVNPVSYTIEPKLLEQAISDRTRAIVPVHLYGRPAEMAEILRIARKHRLKVVEDAAQAHLAEYEGALFGVLGDAAAYSFYPGKNLGALGDAGAVVTNDEAVADRVRLLRDHGRTKKYVHEEIGYNRRMDGLQAAYLSVKLPRLTAWTEARRAVARRYNETLGAQGFKINEDDGISSSSFHLYVTEVSNRDEVVASLKDEGIGAGIHYPVPLHRQPAFRKQGYEVAGGLEHTDHLVERIISLPICPYIRDDEVERVCEVFLSKAVP